MTSVSRYWDYLAPAAAAAANGVLQVNTIGASDHLRHVLISGSFTYISYPTAVVGDDGTLIGVLATFPAAAPPVPSFANAGTWKSGWWGRPVIDSVDAFTIAGGAVQPCRRINWHVEFDYSPEGGGFSGGVFVGWQALYVDPNHELPNVGFTALMWGITI